MDLRAKQNFVRVQITNTRDNPLIQQNRLNRPTTVAKHVSTRREIDL